MRGPQAPHARRTLIGLCIAMGASLMVAASFNFMLTPMLSDLGLTQDEASVALAIPSIASLLIVFVAGRLGESRGHRTVITWMSLVFMVGCGLVTITDGLPLLSIGLLLAGLAATAIQIVVIGLLSDQFPEPGPRAKAFGTFGMVSPFIWLVFPVLTGAIVLDNSWRWVPAIWVLGGLGMLLAARALLPQSGTLRPAGRLGTPMLAGLTVVLAVQALQIAGAQGFGSVWFLGAIALTLLSGAAVLVLLRRSPSPGFSLRALRMRRSRLLLGVVVIIPLINTVFFMTLAFQYLYGLTVLQTALVMIPAQAGAILGTRYLAAPLMARIGVTRTAAWLFGALAIAMLTSLLITARSPLWVPMTYVAIYNVLTVAASITVTNGLMATATTEDSGEVSAYRGSGVALGGVLAVVVMNSIVFALSQIFMQDTFEANGTSAGDAMQLSDQIQASATSPNVMAQFSMPLPSGVNVDSVMQDSIATGLHINGVLGALLSIVSVVLIVRSTKKEMSVANSGH